MTRKQRRSLLIFAGLAVCGVAATLTLSALSSRIVFFHSPAEIDEQNVEPGTRFRLGGLVAEGSIERGQDARVRFVVTDGTAQRAVIYAGILPDLFREGQGVVAEGHLATDGTFLADNVLAKHDENYMPPEVAAALKKQGHWQPEAEKKP
jgi:cytochrome c-type biogenesis protein CcmE